METKASSKTLTIEQMLQDMQSLLHQLQLMEHLQDDELIKTIRRRYTITPKTLRSRLKLERD